MTKRRGMWRYVEVEVEVFESLRRYSTAASGGGGRSRERVENTGVERDYRRQEEKRNEYRAV